MIKSVHDYYLHKLFEYNIYYTIIFELKYNFMYVHRIISP